MNISNELSLSYYKEIATLNAEHKVYIVQHINTHKIYVKKCLDIYNANIYKYLHATPIEGIPFITEVIEDDTTLTIIEEYISGETLQEKILHSSLTKEDISQYIYELCTILNRLHSINPPIIHRDIKPSNIIITSQGRVVLLDFNAAKYYSDDKSSDTVLLGTKGYAAPEQYGFGSSSIQTDIYSIGVLLDELKVSLTNTTNIFDSIIERCTHLDPSDRFASVIDLQKELPVKEKVSCTSKKDSLSAIIPPGFRTRTRWHMILAGIIYVLLTWFCFTLDNTNATSLVENILLNTSIYLVLLSLIFNSFNYLNVHRIMPLCKSKNRLIRYAGIIILDIISFFLIIVVLALIQDTFIS